MKKPTDSEQPTIDEEVAQATEEQPEESLMETVEQEVEAEETAKTEEAQPEAAEEKTKEAKKKEEEEIVEEKTYTVPLSKALIMPPRKRAPRAMRILKAYIIKHMKIPSRAEEEDEVPPQLIVTSEVNEHIWGKGIEKPPRKIRVRVTKDRDNNVTVHLAE